MDLFFRGRFFLVDLFSVGHFSVDVLSVDVISVDLFSYNHRCAAGKALNGTDGTNSNQEKLRTGSLFVGVETDT